MPTQIKCGPSGGIGARDFDDTLLAAGKRITKLTVWHGKWVDAIQVFWSDGSSSDKHGGGGGSGDTIHLAEDEYLVGIFGKYGEKVDSIHFVTNKDTYGRYGGLGGDVEYHYNDAKLPLPNITIVGFFGREENYIYAIGCVFSA